MVGKAELLLQNLIRVCGWFFVEVKQKYEEMGPRRESCGAKVGRKMWDTVISFFQKDYGRTFL